jgi:diacylglycerol kinase
VIGTGAVILAIALRLPVHDVVLIAALTALVLCAELMNTAIEATWDERAGADFDLSVKRIKDIAAAAVAMACLGAAVLGASIFLPAIVQRIAS